MRTAPDWEADKEPLEIPPLEGSLWIKNGATPKQAQTWAGHASIQTTWDIYGHLWREFQDEQSAARAAEQILLS